MRLSITKHCRRPGCPVWLVSDLATHAVVQWATDWRSAADWAFAHTEYDRYRQRALAGQVANMPSPIDLFAAREAEVLAKVADRAAEYGAGWRQLMERATVDWPEVQWQTPAGPGTIVFAGLDQAKSSKESSIRLSDDTLDYISE